MIAVPLLARDGEAIGVVALHTEAPREFGREVVDFLVHVASLLAGAVDSATSRAPRRTPSCAR